MKRSILGIIVRVFVFSKILVLGFSMTACSEVINDEMSEISSKELRSRFEKTGDITFVRYIIGNLRSDDEIRVLDALHSLNVLGVRLKDNIGVEVINAVSPILTEAKDPGLLHSVTATVLSYGEYALPLKEHLKKIVEQNASGAAFFAAQTLGSLGHSANDAQDSLVSVLKSETRTKLYAIESLSKIGPIKDENIMLIDALARVENKDSYFEIGLIKVLFMNGSNDPFLVDRLTEHLRNDSSRRRYKVLETIQEIGLKNVEWAKPLIDDVVQHDPDRSIREYAKTLLE